MKRNVSLFGSAVVLLLPSVVTAQQQSVFERGGLIDTGAKDPNQPKLLAPFGMSATIGGGVRGYFEQSARDVVGSFGVWDGRFVLGTRRVLGFEAGYTGAMGGVDALGLDDNARLLSNAVEGALRLNILAGMWQPYVMAGAGWMRYSITSEDYNTSSLQDNDDQAVFPLGAGLSFRYEGLLADVRGVYRPTAGADLIPEAGSDLATWTAALSAGAEF